MKRCFVFLIMDASDGSERERSKSEPLNTMASITSTSFILGLILGQLVIISKMLILALSLALYGLRGWKLVSLSLFLSFLFFSNRSIRKIGSRVGEDEYKRLSLSHQLPLIFSRPIERDETFGKFFFSFNLTQVTS